MDTVIIGELLALLASFCSAIHSVTYNRMGRSIDIDDLSYVRMAFSVPLILVLCLLFDGSLPLGYSLSSYVLLSLSGIIGFFFCDYYLFRAFVVYGARESAVVMNLVPVINSFLALLLFGEKLTAMKYVAILLVVGGIISMVLGEGKKEGSKRKILSYGLLVVILAAFLQSISDLTAKFALESVPPVSSSLIRISSGFVAWVFWALLKKRKPFGYLQEKETRNRLLLVTLIVVVFGPVGGTTCVMMALKTAPAGIVSVLKQVSPLILIPYDVFVLKRKLTLPSLLGTAISVVGVMMLFA
ncbi:MAG: EamA family transporter [Spirochaetales bacterium]|nr:EamA family transporter [Candidatus Physcosoma equi]